MNSTPTTFKQIFGQKLENETIINGIEIPIIQRDYAQGRNTADVTRIRNRFIDVLYKALTGSVDDAVKLDFIYGNIEDEKLIPLDGQQRLTTLFLLHWYVAKNENIATEDYSFLNDFTYKTRFSSQHFCDRLVNCLPNFEQEKLSTWIKDQNWFMYSWENDPTVKSMLVVIDDLHKVFKKETNLWGKLTDSLEMPISFYFLALEEMGVTDSLYIKMNSRGKPLTTFEHFKAEFEKTIKEVSPVLYQEFIKKVDIDWIDMFWKYRSENNEIDEEFMRFYRFVTEMICYEQNIPIINNDFDLVAKVYGKENLNAQNNLQFLFNAFDSWRDTENIDAFFNNTFSKNESETNKVLLYTEAINLFSICCHSYGKISGKRRQFSLINTLLMYAVQLYLIHKQDISIDDFIKRLRIVRNLAFNSQDEIRETKLTGLLQDVKNSILEEKIELNSLGFNEQQKQQELDKILWRIEHPELEVYLNNLEDQKLLQGNIAIIGLDTPEKFKILATNFIKIFNGDIHYKGISKALLTIGDYTQSVYWRFSFGYNKDASWRELFTPSQKRRGFEKTKEIFSILLDTEEVDLKSYISNLIDIYRNNENTIKNWRYYFIKYPNMISGRSGVFKWYNDPKIIKENQYDVFMMNTSHALSGKHWNPFLYEVSQNENFKTKMTLEQYGSLIILNQKNQKLASQNDGWYIYDFQDNLIQRVEIAQENGNDTENRIDVITHFLTSYLN
ncbi:DUF262 domain-containing protein [Tenacibaculum finnmarkense]|uniref:DUF262 domain-containing protein n=2 Tax=Tenacibaculum finnmarkense TaxID=2781243 RepID=UPI001EFBE1C5|nr:DUF262 domain-containing protein [Tenacibaculum finnmarkense]MCG8761958.1 DUF262 domain-containing protein [Tenacibaculum finnmarkense]MCG8787333.1 DUF262 domain-containing protein [Tenacibaculum finnmarkense]